MKTILITGGAGFVGSHLCKRLLEDGNNVMCLDNLQTGSKKNIEPFMGDERFTFLEMDVRDAKVRDLDIRFDEIYNLACPASPIHYQADPIGTTMACTIGMRNILELANRCGARILQASTSEVYGQPLEHPQKETYLGNVNPCGIRSCYDEGKRCAESLCFDYNRKYGTDVKVVRIFNTYGERMAVNDGRVVSNFIVQALNGEPITIYGDGKQTRSFQYVSDLVEGMIAMMNSNQHGPINIGNPQEYTMNELAEKIIELTGSRSEIVYKELPSDDPLQRRPDISKAKELIGWEPKVDVDEGLKKTIEYFNCKFNNFESA